MQKKLNSNALDLLKKKYFKPGERDWTDLAMRVAKGVASAETSPKLKKQWEGRYYDMISNLEFIPSTPCLLNADVDGKGQLSSCFIVSLRDNIESIYNTKGECAKIFQKNGGAGLNISVLRPADSAVLTSGGKSCGIIGFMEEFDLTADVVTRNNIRKGALKVDLNDWHPDIFKFIHSKDDTTKLTFMNISVSISNKFMDAVEKDLDWDLKFPDYEVNKTVYDAEWDGDLDTWEAKGHPVKVYETIKAKRLYREIMEHAWLSGEPGVSFRDLMDAENPNPHLGRVHSTNPCSEFASIPYNSCNLGSVNLVECITEDGHFDREKFLKLVADSVRFLDDMITVNKLPIAAIEDVTKRVRSIGLGLMGFAHAMFKMGMRYNSAEALAFANDIFSSMYETAVNTSIALAEEKGVYPAWEGSIWQQKGIKIRNSNHLSIAPNGSIAFIAGVTGGIEPEFGLVYSRRTNDGDIYYVVNPIFQEVLAKRGLYTEEILAKIANNHGGCQGIAEIPLDIQHVFVTSHDISPEDHTIMVGTIQKHVDLSISKTVNLLNHATIEDVMDVYRLAHSIGCKGITVYRDGSRDNQTLAVKREATPDVSEISREGLKRGDWKPIAEDTTYDKRKIYIGCGKITLFIGWSEAEQSIQEFWIKRSGQGGCERNLENMTIAMSGMLRLGGSLFNIDKAFDGVGGCNSFIFQRAKGEQLSKGSNCGNAVLNEIKKYLAEKDTKEIKPLIVEMKKVTEEVAAAVEPADKSKCPLCGEKLVLEAACITCKSCGYSKC